MLNSELQVDQEGLRELARKRLEEKQSFEASSNRDAFKLLEDLSIHQEELKIQNEELLRIKLELEISQSKYFQLYDLAPVGYITLDQDHIVRQANLAASKLLGEDKNKVINRGITNHIATQCHELLHLHFTRLAQGDGEQKHILTFRRADGDELQVQFESNLIEVGPEK
ncbi:MAG TPA: PAS domain S-box protein, partial [Methanomassiliicoccales archaeon]|nr:PAS domain S-box protein [Methanomassiliicoccales archaeon]